VGRLLLPSSGKSKKTEDSLGVGGPVITWIARASHRGKHGRSLVVVDNRNEIRQFLTSRRARITPEQAGLPTYGANRRVAGLRREEVALLAGVSVDYYTRLERGNLGGVSEAVLDALARALQLDEAERGHLFDLARAANTTARNPRRRPTLQRVRPGVQRILDALTDAPADVRNGRRDILAANRLGYALYSELFIDPVRPANVARFLFLSPRAQDFFPDWEGTANDLVANLRTEAGRTPYDRGLQDLVGELSTRSQEFRTRWAAHNVRHHQTGRKRLHHPVVGDLELTYEVLALPADPGLSLVVYGAEPGSASQDGLRLLASWAATLDQVEQAATAQAPEDA
jgi:transcriptional regulator with XRE-family HTH domain